MSTKVKSKGDRHILPRYEFHLERNLRMKYQVEESFFSQHGAVVFTDFAAVRRFVHLINSKRDPRLHVYPGQVYAAGLLEEIFHFVFRRYEEDVNQKVFEKAFKRISKAMGREMLDYLLYDFCEKFPNNDIFMGRISIKKYLQGNTGAKPNIQILLEEAIMLFFANFNPANGKIKDLFNDKHLADPELFRLMIDHLEDFFEDQPPFGPDNQDIFSLFKTSILASPNDISKQLDYILEKWQWLLPESIINQLLRGKDLLKEDVRFDTQAGVISPTAAPVYKGKAGDGNEFLMGKSGYNFFDDSTKDYEEAEAFTPDVHWMPSVVMIAKNTYVWLDQLSKKYQRNIRRLDQIPDEELDLLRQWNFTALWLIGIWERSEASRRIKHIMGNIDAVSSAYSLFDYHIAGDLGGEEAYQNLNERARSKGIRLASDMVPNHTGIYSKWVIEHPDFFIQAPVPPFPGYTFNGENLSQHPGFEIKLEDGYYNRTDAAVVFQWLNKQTGQVRYIYHGNDGTNMPWNDTAQLDMIKHEVRQAVIEKIFEVARKFSIIRFDAAMTLAKKHFSRLWYPRPGMGGDIPSRSDYAMTQAEFDTLFPVEFWREVVDRMNAEMPDTLLLAEAFWFMEGYFVRTLGMHRVYNSAFMHMLKNEENEKYRDLITNTLEFEPEILKRYVNFMSNPDEETAIRQFGTGDKYFGVCVLMNTLPGLPMFAHGQIEGYSEKYGMEYQRAYYNEEPSNWLVQKHIKEIFPLTRKRYLFSEVDNFNCFDFVDHFGNVNENVFAFTNRFRDEKVLVLYNNKYEEALGRIQFSAPKLSRSGSSREPVSVSLAQALGCKGNHDIFYVFREHFSGLEYIKPARDLHNNGFQWSLKGFEYRLFWEFREVHDTSGEYEKLVWKTSAGVQSIEQALQELKLKPVHEAFEAMFDQDIVNFLVNRLKTGSGGNGEKLGYALLKSRFIDFLNKTANHFQLPMDDPAAAGEMFISRLKSIEKGLSYLRNCGEDLRIQLARLGAPLPEDIITLNSKSGYREKIAILIAAISIEIFLNQWDEDLAAETERKINLHWPLYRIFLRAGKGEYATRRDVDLVLILKNKVNKLFDFSQELPAKAPKPSGKGINNGLKAERAALALEMLSKAPVLRFLMVNEYNGVTYYSKESYEELVQWLFTVSLLRYLETNPDCESLKGKKDAGEWMTRAVEFLVLAHNISLRASYQFIKFKVLLKVAVKT